MHINTTFTPPGDRVGAILAVASYLDCEELGAAIDALIERMDAAAGDPDMEPDGDEEDGSCSEEDFMTHGVERGAGCPLADPTEGGSWAEGEQGGNACYADDEREDDGREERQRHRDRIRRTRCEVIRYAPRFGGLPWTDYKLIETYRAPRFHAATELPA